MSPRWQDFVAAVDPGDLAMISGDIAENLPQVWAVSDFIALSCVRNPTMFIELAGSGDLERAYAEDHYGNTLTSLVANVSSQPELMQLLRRVRRREMVRIAWRDITGWSDLEETTRDLSLLAEACIRASLAWLHPRLCQELGEPCNADGVPQQLVVIGMGKLGAGELNFSSDIDLIFAYPEAGETQVESSGARNAVSHGEFFSRLGRELIQCLDQATADGFVFRVDMRLRPFGDSGPLVTGFDAMEHYYQAHGREWERYAFIKARVVAGEADTGVHLMQLLKPFVYRRYVDFGAFESLREMKALIVKEVQRKGLDNNVKLGPGGIREIEFIAQAFQLLRGGADPQLQERRLLRVLEQLTEKDYLPRFVVDELSVAYVFLRNVEHRLQEWADQQTHTLPSEPIACIRLAFAMGFTDWEVFAEELARHRQHVHAHFEQIFEAPQTEHPAGQGGDLGTVWAGSVDDAQALQILGAAGYFDPAELLRRLKLLRDSRNTRSLSARGRGRLDTLIPLALGAATATDSADASLLRVLKVLESIGQRSVYLALLVENPMALSQLVRLCAGSPWIADYLAQQPMLLDELLDPRSLYAPAPREQLQQDLRQRIAALPADADEGQAMDRLRHFKLTNVLRVAAADLVGALPVMKVSDQLTWIAEVALEDVLRQAWLHMIERYGRPVCTAADGQCDTGFAIVAYGKLGGLELGYGSDLDLVFLHGGEDDLAETDGENPVALPVFFARLGQRIIHILTARTPAGELYEVDMRLRPNGSSGMLVSSLRAFDAYQTEKAWIWEHQALVRARVVCGDPAVAERFDIIRRTVLGQRRDAEAVQQEVVKMRERMREANCKSKTDEFDLKQDRGAIADIEFMVQYGVLAWAADHPELLDFTDNIRLLAAFSRAGLMPEDDTALLSEAYRTFRNRLHRLTLQAQPGIVARSEHAELAGQVIDLWNTWMVPTAE